MSENIAPLRARVRLEAPTPTPDDMGGAAFAFEDRGAVWVEIVARATRHGDAFDAASAATMFSVTMRPRADIAAGWAIVWGVRRLRVLGVRDDGGARIVLDCEEARP